LVSQPVLILFPYTTLFRSFRTVQKSPDLRRGGCCLASPAQNLNIRIGQDPEARVLRSLERTGVSISTIAELAYAEEGEVLVAQPLQEGGGFLHSCSF